MKIKSLINKPEIHLERGKLYEVEDVIQDCYKIKIPKKQKGKFDYALLSEDEGVLID